MNTQPEDETNERVPCTVLGTEIGTMSGWDKIDSWTILFAKFTPNELGVKFLRIETVEDMPAKDVDLIVSYEEGKVQLSALIPVEGEENYVDITPDWSVFNTKPGAVI